VRQVGIVGVAVATLFAAASAEDSPSARVDQKTWLDSRKAELQTYLLMARDSGRETPLDFQPEPVLSWSNPIRKAAFGGTFLWTRSGRPQVIASVFNTPNAVAHEFTSLAETPLVVSRDREIVWTPRRVEFHEMPDAPESSASRPLRIAQMRKLADRFRVSIGKDSQEVLRRLSQPLYRFPDSSATDGAVFGFVQTTDPEALLVLESTGERGWRYAFARMTTYLVQAELDEKLVWDSGPAVGRRADPETTYHNIYLNRTAQPRDP
jgi:hypothetical protein